MTIHQPELVRQHESSRSPDCPLEQRELYAVGWLCQGKTAGEIAEIAGEHRMTVQRRIHRIYEKTGANNWHGLVGMAYRNGWVSTQQELLSMHGTMKRPVWTELDRAEKINMVVEAHKSGFTTSNAIASELSEVLNCIVTRESICGLYYRMRNQDSPLKAYPLTGQPSAPEVDLEAMERLWRQGLSGTAIARRLGTTMRVIYYTADQHRDRFPVRRAKINSPGVVVMSVDRIAEGGSSYPHPDRVTRITFSGSRVTMPRVSFIDGSAP